MKTIFSALLIMSTLMNVAFSMENKKLNPKGSEDKFKPSAFEIVPLNSPVKGATADFSLKLPQGFEVDKLKVRLVKAHELKPKDLKNEVVTLSGNHFSLNVSKLPPGFYRLFVVAIDRKSGSEQPYRKQFHDYVRFVIDESLEVPMPDPKINNATLGGVDSDNNGIRDDIQRYINEKYSNKPSTKLALKQLAMASQAKILNSLDKETTIFYGSKETEAIYCLAWISDGVSAFVKEFEPMELNTKERIQKSLKIRQWFHGQGIPEYIQRIGEENDGNYSPLCSFENATIGQ